MTTDISRNTNKDVNGALITGVLLSIVGVIAIAVPNFTTLFAETWIAAILIFAGFTKLVYATQTRDRGGFIWKLLLSGLYIATGIMLFVYPFTGILTLTLLLGTFLLTEGTFELILAFQLRPQQNWTWILSNGIITLVLGAMIWFQWPFNAPWLLGTLVGISIIFSGISRVMLSLNARSTSNPPDQAANPT
ncbi:MAG: HdeD family acid-resistance protein [Nostoc sp.]|uniref:HdeD family acid-resistance protein n=1 Tax=Nostoc sp. TaxID=1180 RepID=UPI002FF9EC8D